MTLTTQPELLSAKSVLENELQETRADQGTQRRLEDFILPTSDDSLCEA